ncbi:Oidioi.mRNA.OKI2018_I69.PAR.g9023.t1.cds [Oikopleura dioica]|uniref:Oidioi.mRNA.OKI2018_I69.PAR.g9023.t1.cds n=1 Tax=Oikopleura dioica TaxID=34765 RepID=A0ABN7RMW3_OIKDI|nr:Oidioi.mRNA.OKI2018_I69.PAR.g9023.t1.cds [Oikopleura dioica]
MLVSNIVGLSATTLAASLGSQCNSCQVQYQAKIDHGMMYIQSYCAYPCSTQQSHTEFYMVNFELVPVDVIDSCACQLL